MGGSHSNFVARSVPTDKDSGHTNVTTVAVNCCWQPKGRQFRDHQMVEGYSVSLSTVVLS